MGVQLSFKHAFANGILHNGLVQSENTFSNMASVKPEEILQKSRSQLIPLAENKEEQPQSPSQNYYRSIVQIVVVGSLIQNIFFAFIYVFLTMFASYGIIWHKFGDSTDAGTVGGGFIGGFTFICCILIDTLLGSALSVTKWLWAATNPRISSPINMTRIKHWLHITLGLISIEALQATGMVYLLANSSRGREQQPELTDFYKEIVLLLVLSVSSRVASVFYVKGFYKYQLVITGSGALPQMVSTEVPSYEPPVLHKRASVTSINRQQPPSTKM